MQKIAFESFIIVFLLNTMLLMKPRTIFRIVSFLGVFAVASLFPLVSGEVKAQISGEIPESRINSINYNKLSLRHIVDQDLPVEGSEAEDLKMVPLTIVEENVARNLNSHWTWPEYTLDMIDSYSPFLFRTKKSASLDEVKVLLQVNARGRLSGFEVVGEIDNGLKERLDHMLRKLPECKPVPGYEVYSPEIFELVIRK